MPQLYSVYLYELNTNTPKCIGTAYSDDTIALVKHRIAWKTKTSHQSLKLYYTSEDGDNLINIDNLPEVETCTLLSSLNPRVNTIVCKIIDVVNEDGNNTPLTPLHLPPVYFDESIDEMKEQIKTTFCCKKEFHHVITIPAVLFLIGTLKGKKDIWDMCQISANVPCIIECKSRIDPPKIYLYRDIVSLEPNENVIFNWWRKRLKKQQNWKYIIQLKSDSEIFGNNQYSTLLINHNNDVYYEWSYSTPVQIDIIQNGIGNWIQKTGSESFGGNINTTLIMKECIIRYEVFLSVSDLFQLFDCCSDTIDSFFEVPSEDKRFNLRYRPKYCNNTPNNCVINVKFQKMSQNNSILIVISTQQATWVALQDTIEVLFYLFGHEQLREIRPSEVSYKDLDPYLFRTNVKKGGYTRQCLNFNDYRFGKKATKRYKVPHILFTKEDFKIYEDLPPNDKRYILYYRGNYYSAIDDYRNNKDVVNAYNDKPSTKKKESFLNTVVLFEIQQKYRDGTQEQLYYPGCVRAKSGIPALKHQYILQKLLRNGEIKLFGADADQMIKKLETNEKLKRGDVIHYISKFPGRLTSDSYAYLPSLVKKMLIPQFNDDTRELIRKGVYDGLFIHAVSEACDVNYRIGWTDSKQKIVKNVMKTIFNMITHQIFRWLSFGNVAKQMSYTTFIEQFENYEYREHIYLCDLLSMFYNVNMFIIHLNINGALEKITRTTQFFNNRFSIILLKYNKSYELVMKLKLSKRKTTSADCSQWESNTPLIEKLNDIFLQTNIIAKDQVDHIEQYHLNDTSVLGQVVDIFNQCVGCIDRWGFFLTFDRPCVPLPVLPMFTIYNKHTVQQTLNRLKNHSSVRYSSHQRYILDSQDNIIAIQTGGGEIIPCIEEKYDKNIMQQQQQQISTVNHQHIPYKENVTHYRVQISHEIDQRIQLINDKNVLKKTISHILLNFKKILMENKVISLDQWTELAEIRNVRQKQEVVFPLYMFILNNAIFEMCPDNNEHIQFRDDTKIIVKTKIFEKAVFQCFHYLIRTPSFGIAKHCQEITYQVLKPSTKDSVMFDSVEGVEEYISNIQNPDKVITSSRQMPFDNNNMLKLFTFPLVHTADYPHNFKNDASKDYIKNLALMIAPKLLSFQQLTPFCKKCLLYSIILSRTIVVTDNHSVDKYNPSAGNDLVIVIKNNKK
jgi:hypothetical protein